MNLHIDFNVAIEKRKNFDTIIDRETISVQNIDFFDISIDKKFEKISEKIINKSIIIFDDAKNDEKNKKIIDRKDETNEIKNEITNSTNY